MIDTHLALLTQLVNASIRYISSGDIAFSNEDFDPTGKDAWLGTAFLPASRFTDSKSAGVGVVDTGIFQVTINVPMNDTTGGQTQYNSRALHILEDLLAAFPDGQQLTNGVSVSDSSFAGAFTSEAWYQLPVSINYIKT